MSHTGISSTRNPKRSRHFWRCRPENRPENLFALIAFVAAMLTTPAQADALFDPEFYLAANHDVAAAGVDPRWHYRTFGWREGRDPNPMFSTSFYLSRYRDVAAAGVNPLDHYATWGWRERRDPSPQFSTAEYLRRNPDVAAVSMNPLEHFLEYGQYEGRWPAPDLGEWMAQSRNCDGDYRNQITEGDRLTCRKGDLGGPYILFDTFRRHDGGAITSFDQPPLGAFTMNRDGFSPSGDGGESYVLEDGQILIPHTQDAGKPFTQTFEQPWVKATVDTWDCRYGWKVYNDWDRGCRMWVNWPRIGWVDTFISQHGDDNGVEQHAMGRGWGLLGWWAFTHGPPQVPASEIARRCPDFGITFPWKPGHVLVDCRIIVDILRNLSGSQMPHGWQMWSPERGARP